ncbi:MAG TPA: cell division ATP-binding protein FtsE [Verrucomicrobiae bacterium]|nr:cell division ATP-binding protein FtsE [Verrucomicrobiae bacterium]
MTDIVHFHNVSHRYGDSGAASLTEVTFRVARGEMAFITGASGAGKSTLLRLVALLTRPARGEVVVNGVNLSTVPRGKIPEYRQQIGLIFQNFNLLNDRTVHDNVALPLVIRGYDHRAIGRRVRAALDSVGLLGKERLLPLMLSGGEQQRVGIARAIVTKPMLLIADEPTGNLDPKMAREVMQVFERFNQVGVSVLVATHAIDLIKQLPHRLIHLHGGRIRDDEPMGFARPAAPAGPA